YGEPMSLRSNRVRHHGSTPPPPVLPRQEPPGRNRPATCTMYYKLRRGRSIATASCVVAGRRLMTRTRPASWTASSMSWVTERIVLRSASQIRTTRTSHPRSTPNRFGRCLGDGSGRLGPALRVFLLEHEDQ